MERPAAPPGRAKRETTPSKVADLLIELGSAIKKVGMYPPGHQALVPAIEALMSRLSAILEERPTLVLGVGRDELLVDGTPTDATHPIFVGLASRLHRHELGAVTFAEGVTSEEIADFLHAVAVDPERSGRPLGSEPEGVLWGRPHIRLEPAGYTKLRLKQRTAGASADEDAEARAMWRNLAQAAASGAGREDGDDSRRPASLAAREAAGLFRRSDAGTPTGPEAPPPDQEAMLDPEELARHLQNLTSDVGFDRTMARQMATIARNLAELDPEEDSHLRHRFTQLLSSLDGDTLQRLISAGDDERARRQFLLDSVRGAGADAMLTLIRAAAGQQSRDISRSMLRLMSKMASHAGQKGRPVQSAANLALREQVGTLLADWELENPNPEGYERSLGRLSLNALETAGSDDRRIALEAERMAHMSLETGVAGDILALALDRLVAEGRIADLATWMDVALQSDSSNAAALQVRERLSDPVIVRGILEHDTPDFVCLDQVLPLSGIEASDALLDRLATAERLSLRRGLFDRLAGLGPGVGPRALCRLEGSESPPWFVVRNVVALMGELPRWPETFDPWAYHAHEHAQVRFEALKLCMRLGHRRDDAVLAALRDSDPKVRSMGVVEAEQGVPPGAESTLREVATDPGEEGWLRLPAIRALGKLGTPEALHALIEAVALRRRLLRGAVVEATPAKVAAVRALVATWPEDPSVKAIRRAAAASASPLLRAAAGDGSDEEENLP